MNDFNKKSKTDIPCPCLGDKQKEAPVQWPLSAGIISTAPSVRMASSGSKIIFQTWYVQRGIGPHNNTLVYASDENWDTFHSDIRLTDKGVEISETEGHKNFAINVRWNVEGFGAGYLTADNGGEFYQLPESENTLQLNLNFELANSRVARNRKRIGRFVNEGWKPPKELSVYHALSEELLSDARIYSADNLRCAELAQKVLYYALWASEMLELDYADWCITKNGARPGFLFGCDVRQYHQVNKDTYMDRFSELFNFAHLTFVPEGDEQMGVFEKQPGQYNFKLRDILFNELREHNIQVGGRLMHWFHTWVTPDWLKEMDFDGLLKYVEKKTRDLIRHYGKEMYSWEIVNELHDWANAVQLTPDQAVELTRFACEVARSENTSVKLMINHCCPFAEYVQMAQWSGGPASYPQRTPWQFTKDLIDAGTDFDIIGQQMYFPYHDLQDIIIFLERYQIFDKKVQLSETGVTSGRTDELVHSPKYRESHDPYIWRRPWDEELQADWLEGLYRLAFSRPWIDASSWFDFYDQHTYIDNGGLIKNDRGDRKVAYHRLKKLQNEFKNL